MAVFRGILVMVRKNMRNFAPSKRKMRISSRPKKLLLFVNLFVWLNPKKLWLRWPLFPISWLNYAEESTLTADKVLPHFAETSWRPWEYFRKRMKNSNGRQSTRCCRTEYSHGQLSACYNCGNTPTGQQSACYGCGTTPIGWYSTWCYSDGALSRQTACSLQLWKHFDGGDRELPQFAQAS